uniref:Anthranilate synthase component 2 n=1 Tax=Caloglossa intermedia TaxID=100879 RepID=A0A1Z1M5M4_9FLOR|nr:Anthranilate synthase component II [Caloglossa intermedia]ARW61378.1 Anthranilate synthase component II [Caloglossa intermedia]
MILIIDNYDSFTYNLVQNVGELKLKIQIERNDEISVKKIANINPSHIIISPGPGNPKDSGACLDILTNYAQKIPILGVCLGHQTIGYTYGAKIKQLITPFHGKTSEVFHNKHKLFNELPSPFLAARYHSLTIDKNSLPENLKVIAWAKDNTIMGCQHKIYPKLCGVQFHPESLWTHSGKTIIHNFLFS